MAIEFSVKQSILDVLGELRGLGPLKDLFWTELNYNRVNKPLVRTGWPVSTHQLLTEDPVVLASGGDDGGFHILYCRVAADRLSVVEEREVISQLIREHPYALFVFSNHSQDLWHFVNVKMGRSPADMMNHGNVRRQVFRRISVSPGEKLRTAAERLAMLDLAGFAGELAGSALAIQQQHDEAFDVEKVTKAFYRSYRDIFEKVERLIEGFDDDGRKRMFTQRLFNRLMFVAFVQKKGWLEFQGSRDYLDALWRDYMRQQVERGDTNNFYRERLELLFFAAFNGQRNTMAIGQNRIIQVLVGNPPYLNGGLFEEDALDSHRGLMVPDTAIDLILHQLFGRFNFTITEATPLDVEVAVDPEMLGKVFEELVTGRHESGSYYTPKPIVSFMCREGLKGYLLTAVPHESEASIARFVDEQDPVELRDGEAVLRALREVKACDPACGSGAYLLGLLHELLDLRAALFATSKLDTASIYERKLEIVQNNVYGVDIDPFAVNIARLRLWLSLVVDYERTNCNDPIPPLPNLDFKIESGDSLAAPMERQYHLSDMTIREFDRAKATYMRSHEGQKRLARAEVERLRQDIAAWAHGGAAVEGFDWPVEFAEVFADQLAPAALDGGLNLGDTLAANRLGGFDIVLANPPYVRMELIKEHKPALRRNFPHVHAERADLYVYFYARALELLAPGGMLVFISSNKWFRAGYGAKLRKHVAEEMRVWSITDFGELPVFENASTFPMIFVAQKNVSGRNAAGLVFTQVKSLNAPYPDVREMIHVSGVQLSGTAIQGADWVLADDQAAALMERMTVGTIPLGTYVNGQIYWGVKTGLNRAFVINNASRNQLILENPRSAEIIKPMVVGDDVRKWHLRANDNWLLYMYHGIDVTGLEAVLQHLLPFKDKLEARATKQEWYELQQPQMRYRAAFEHPKILYPEIAKEPRFTFDVSGRYPNNKTFFIPSDDLYLLGILNSAPGWEFLKNTCSVLGDPAKGGRLELRAHYLERFPVPKAASNERVNIAKLVQNCLDANGEGPNVSQWEAEIDDRVSRLYGLIHHQEGT